MSGASFIKKKCCCEAEPFDCFHVIDHRCCHSDKSTATVTWAISGSATPIASGSFVLPWANNAGQGDWILLAAIGDYDIEAFHQDSSSATTGIWSLTFTDNIHSKSNAVELVYSGGSGTSEIDAKCCGITAAGTVTGDAPDAGRSISVTIVVNNNKCCSVLNTTSPVYNFSCTKRTSDIVCDDDDCNTRCAGCCATYRVVLGNAGAFNGTYDLSQLDNSDTDATCLWRYSAGGLTILIDGRTLTVLFSSTTFTYLSDPWTGCPNETWTYDHKAGGLVTDIPTLIVATLDCP